MKVIFNQEIIKEKDLLIGYNQKNYFSGDFVNVYCWIFQHRLIFWEDVYFQLMANMRKMRISIPMSYTPQMFENQIKLLCKENEIYKGCTKITVFRNLNTPSFIIEFLPYKDFFISAENKMEVYKDIIISPSLLSAISIFHPINLIADQYAKENQLQEVILLNGEKRISRSIFGNIFLVNNNVILSNPNSEGAFISCLKKNFLIFLRQKTEFIYKEECISPFQTQSANEIFILSDQKGIIPINKIRKTTFNTEITHYLAKKFIGYALNA